MSDKIYEAYRFPRSRLDEFLVVFRKHCFKKLKALIVDFKMKKKFLREIRKEVVGKNRKVYRMILDIDLQFMHFLARGMIASKRSEHDFFDLDCSCNLWMDDEWCYMIPYVGRLKLAKGKPRWWETYGYWNNVDMPRGMSEERWKARGEIWNRIALDDWDKTRLSYIALQLKMPELNGMKAFLEYAITGKDKEKRIEMIYVGASSLYWEMDEKEREEKYKRDKAYWEAKEEKK